ncbi:MAG TPA: GNAT family N-acetyltransferase [Acidimicrobiales bacterium]|nr:GNAT family N-acetyltransferase [Acidimicrobiales bacterium]
MRIRDRRDDDLEELVAVAARVHEADQYPIFLPDGDLKRFLTRPKPLAAWVAVRNERLIGHVALNAETSRPVMQLVAALKPKRSAVYVARLLVDGSARREGVGRMLLEHARQAAVDSGHLPVLDVVDTPAAAAAISLYRRDGWEEVGRVSFELVDTEVDELVFRGPLA